LQSIEVVEDGLQDLSATLIKQSAAVVLEGEGVRRSSSRLAILFTNCSGGVQNLNDTGNITLAWKKITSGHDAARHPDA
jgi:hypothetical protein